MQEMIEIPVRKVVPNESGVIKITQEAMSALAEVQVETGLSAKAAASIIITQAVKKNLIVYMREG